MLLDNVYETLVNQDQSTGKLVPGLAKSWTVSADEKTYTFELAVRSDLLRRVAVHRR